MSRIGKKPVAIPAGVEVKFENGVVFVKGPKGELLVEDGNVSESRDADSKEERSAHGLYRTLIHNMILGVSEGFEKKLEMVGVGYRAEKKGDTLILHLGYSHPIEMKDPEGITTEVPSQTDITVKGIDKAEVGNYAAVIRAHRKPEPYKGKGVKYAGEVIIRKEGKSGAK